MELAYNIDFEIAAAVFNMVLWLCMNYFFATQTDVSRAFRDLVMWALVATILDLTTALTISYGNIVPFWFNNLLNTIYFATTGVMGYSYTKYINTYVRANEKKDVDVIISKVVICAICLMLVVNFPIGFMFSFNATDGYVHGPLYFLVFVLPVYYLLYAVVVAVVNRKCFSLKQLVACFLYMLLILIGLIIQFFFLQNVLLTMFFVSVGIWITFLAMETPDYQLFLETMYKLNDVTIKAKEAANKVLEINESKDTFLKNVNKDLKQPVNKINAYTQRISAKTADQDILKDTEKIIESIGKLNEVLKDINDYISLSNDETELNIEEYSPKEMLDNCAKLGRDDAREKNLDFEYEIDEKFPKKVFGDRSRLSQIITSLLYNSVKFTQVGKVKLKALWHQDEEDKSKGKMSIEVSDTGVGMRPEERDSLEKTLKSGVVGLNHNARGRGLGLNIATRLLSLMGSKLKFKSEYGKGTTFSFDVVQGIDKPAKVEPILMEEDFNKTKAELDLKEDLLANKLAEVGLEINKQENKNSDLKTAENEEKAKVRPTKHDNILQESKLDAMLNLVKENKEKAAMPETKEVKEELKKKLKEELKDPKDKKSIAKKAKLSTKQEDNPLKTKLDLVKEDKIHRVEPIAQQKNIEPSKNAENKYNQNKLLRGDVLKLEKGLKGFDVELGLKYCMNDVAFYKDMLNTYVENEKMGDLLTYIQMENWDAFLLTLRSIRNTSHTIGAMELAKHAKELELAFKRGDLDYIRSDARNFLALYKKTIDIIKGYQEEA